MFQFSNKVGAIITYLLIQSMNPSNKIMGNTKIDEEIDLNVEWWIDDAITSLREVLLPVFKELTAPILIYDDFVNSGGSIDYVRGGLAVISYLYDRPLYTLKEKFISELMAAFSRSYPTLATVLEKIRYRVPMVVAQEIKSLEYDAYRLKQQKSCVHDYKPPLNKELSNKSNNNILHCRKCHKTKYKKNPFSHKL